MSFLYKPFTSGHLHIVLGREDGSSVAGHVVGDYDRHCASDDDSNLSTDDESDFSIDDVNDDGWFHWKDFQGDLIIFTTAEVVIGECQDAAFSRCTHKMLEVQNNYSQKKIIYSREYDPATGFDELKVETRRN